MLWERRWACTTPWIPMSWDLDCHYVNISTKSNTFMPWKHSSIPVAFLFLRQDSENLSHRGWLRPGESEKLLFPQEVRVSPIFSILFGCYVFGTFQLKPRPALHHMLVLQDPSRSQSDTPVTQMCLLPGHAHFRLKFLTYPRPWGSGSDSSQEIPHCSGEMGSGMSVDN